MVADDVLKTSYEESPGSTGTRCRITPGEATLRRCNRNKPPCQRLDVGSSDICILFPSNPWHGRMEKVR